MLLTKKIYNNYNRSIQILIWLNYLMEGGYSYRNIIGNHV